MSTAGIAAEASASSSAISDSSRRRRVKRAALPPMLAMASTRRSISDWTSGCRRRTAAVARGRGWAVRIRRTIRMSATQAGALTQPTHRCPSPPAERSFAASRTRPNSSLWPATWSVPTSALISKQSSSKHRSSMRMSEAAIAIAVAGFGTSTGNGCGKANATNPPAAISTLSACLMSSIAAGSSDFASPLRAPRDASLTNTTPALRRHLCSRFAFNPCACAIRAIDAPGAAHSFTGGHHRRLLASRIQGAMPSRLPTIHGSSRRSALPDRPVDGGPSDRHRRTGSEVRRTVVPTNGQRLVSATAVVRPPILSGSSSLR